MLSQACHVGDKKSAAAAAAATATLCRQLRTDGVWKNLANLAHVGSLANIGASRQTKISLIWQSWLVGTGGKTASNPAKL